MSYEDIFNNSIKNSKIHEMFNFVDQITKNFSESVKFELNLERSPNKVTFDTTDVQFYFENSSLVDSYDFFLIDSTNDEAISESEIFEDEIEKIEAWIINALQKYYKIDSVTLIKRKTNSLLNRIRELRNNLNK